VEGNAEEIVLMGTRNQEPGTRNQAFIKTVQKDSKMLE
jgi:hypothetical protein